MTVGLQVYNSLGEITFDSSNSLAQISSAYQATGVAGPDNLYTFKPSIESSLLFFDMNEGGITHTPAVKYYISEVQTRMVREVRLPTFITDDGEYGLRTYNQFGELTFSSSNKTIHVKNIRYSTGTFNSGVLDTFTETASWVHPMRADTGKGFVGGQGALTYPMISKSGSTVTVEEYLQIVGGFVGTGDPEVRYLLAE